MLTIMLLLLILIAFFLYENSLYNYYNADRAIFYLVDLNKTKLSREELLRMTFSDFKKISEEQHNIYTVTELYLAFNRADYIDSKTQVIRVR